MQRILQQLHIQPIMPAPSPSTTIADGTEHHVDDAQVNRPHDMPKDHLISDRNSNQMLF